VSNPIPGRPPYRRADVQSGKKREEGMRRLSVVLAGIAVSMLVVTVAIAAPAPKTFVAVLNAADEVPQCAAAGNDARGVAIFHVVDQAAGTVRYKLIANNVPGTTVAAHIHIAPEGVAGPIVQGLFAGASTDNGVLAEGTFTNPTLVAALQANPQAYYVNVHSAPACGPGAIRGQLGTQGPPGSAE
jgi:hypothetical protein